MQTWNPALRLTPFGPFRGRQFYFFQHPIPGWQSRSDSHKFANFWLMGGVVDMQGFKKQSGSTDICTALLPHLGRPYLPPSARLWCLRAWVPREAIHDLGYASYQKPCWLYGKCEWDVYSAREVLHELPKHPWTICWSRSWASHHAYTLHTWIMCIWKGFSPPQIISDPLGPENIAGSYLEHPLSIGNSRDSQRWKPHFPHLPTHAPLIVCFNYSKKSN